MSAINWFEIPTTDLDRAAKFYETMLATKLKREVFGGVPHAMFADKTTDGALIADAKRKPNATGTMIYLNANGKLDACISRVSEAGGKLILPKTDIGDPGFIAIVADTEGNVVGLHSER